MTLFIGNKKAMHRHRFFSASVDRPKRLCFFHRLNYVFISVDKKRHFLNAIFLRPFSVVVYYKGQEVFSQRASGNEAVTRFRVVIRTLFPYRGLCAYITFIIHTVHAGWPLLPKECCR
jgi:hypothetical protein